MKTKLLPVLIALFCLILAVFSFAQAEESNPLKVAMQLSNSNFTEPEEITVSIRISNAGDTALPGPVTLYYSNGDQVEEFGEPVLEAGASKSWSGPLQVTQSMLEAGKISFRIRYSLLNEAGEAVQRSRNFSKEISYTGGVASVEVNRTISPTTAGKGHEVNITYDVLNTGTVDVTNVVITENKSIATKEGVIDRVPAGEKASYTFKVTMGTQDLTSQATIAYTANGQTQTISKEPAEIKYGEINLKANLTTDKKGGLPGDKVKFTLRLGNSGKKDYINIRVTDPTLGELFSGETAPAGHSIILEKEIEIVETTDYQFTVTATEDGGPDIETTSDRITITAVTADQVVHLDVRAESDREVVYQLPGTVRFKVYVSNNSSLDVSNVVVSASGVTLYTFPSILAGETREFTRDVDVSMAGQYQFVAQCRNQLGDSVSFDSNIIYIGFTEPTPVPTEAPIVTPPVPVLDELPTEADLPENLNLIDQILKYAIYVFAAIFAVFLLLVIVALLRRASIKAKSEVALDTLERGGTRDYNQPGHFDEDMDSEPPVTSSEDPLPEDNEDAVTRHRRHSETSSSDTSV